MITRRQILGGAASAMMVPLLGAQSRAAINDAACWNPPTIDTPRKPEAAASLRRILEDHRRGVYPRLKMTRIDGYIEKDGDLLPWGRIESGAPELESEDLVVAIRSAMRLYERSDRPSVSIEATPEFMREFATAIRSMGDNRVAIEKYCQEKGGAFPRVWGMPRDSRVAKALLDADYRMKKVSVGTASLPIRNAFAAVEGLNGTLIPMLKNEIRKRRNPDASFRRLWFYPGRASFIQDKDGVFFDCVQIVLRTEALTKEDSGEIGRAFDDFTCAWTNRMDEIARSEPVWRDLVNQFRHFALARTLLNDDSAQVDMWIVQELKRYRTRTVDVPSHLPPVLLFDRVTVPEVGFNEHRVLCAGGVTMPVSTTKRADASNSIRADVRRAGEIVVASASSCTESCWSIG